MRALDDLGGAIVTPDTLDERLIRLPRVFSDKDIARAPQVSRSLPQCAAGQQEFIAKGCLSIHQHDIQPVFEMQILQAIVKQECVNFPFVDGKETALYAIFIHEHDHVFQIVRQHVRFVTSST